MRNDHSAGLLGGDLAIYDGEVITMDPERPNAEAVLIRDGVIAAIGSNDEIAHAAGSATPTLDGGRRSVIPAFVDGHTHFELTAVSKQNWVNAQAPPCRSLEEIAERIRGAACNGPDDWIVCRSSFDLQRKISDGRLFDRHELDRLLPDRPLMVMAGLHVAMCNSLGLSRLGILEGRIPTGTNVDRDAAGEPTGIVTEIWDLLPSFAPSQIAKAISDVQSDLLLSNGIGTIHTIPFNERDPEIMQQLQRSGRLKPRVRAYYHVPRMGQIEDIIARGIRSGDGDDWFRQGGLKIFVDGLHGDGIAERFDDTKWTPEELESFLLQANEAGLQVWMHGVSPGAIRMAAEATHKVYTKCGSDALRHRIEHGGDYLDPDDIEWLQSVGARVVTTPQFLFSNSQGFDKRPAPLRTLISSGMEPIGGTDSTGTVPEGTSPMFNIACAVNRGGPDSEPIAPEEAIGLLDALRLYTHWSAAGGHEDDRKGMLKVGYLADLAVLSHSVLGLPSEELFDVGVDTTVLAGDVVYSR